jgi:biopolymer transport protein ExbB
VQARGGITLVDEIYLPLSFDARFGSSALALDENVISINSFSKYFNMTGWRLGGLVLPPTLVDEVIAVSRRTIPPADVVDKLASSSVLGGILASGFRAVLAEPRLSEQNLRQAFENTGRQAVHRLERYLNALGTIATAAPLLGLLGTVVGMIEIFASQAPASGGQNPQQLAHGISIALYNTAFGLIIAIPALMFHRYFRARVETFRLGMELAVERMVPHLMRLGYGSRGSAS